jgi:hypothetical protein
MFGAYIASLDATMHREMVKAATSTAAIKMSALTPEEQVRSKELFCILAMLWKERAMNLLQLVRDENGYEAYRQMKAKMEVDLPGRHLSLLQHVLNHKFDHRDMVDSIQDFNIKIERYEAQTTTIMDDSVKCALLLQGCPASIQQHINANADQYDSYAKMSSVVTRYALGMRDWSAIPSATSSPVPMEVDALGKSKGKGGKSKGKGDKGKGKSDKGKDKGGKGYGQQSWWQNKRTGELVWFRDQSSCESKSRCKIAAITKWSSPN